MTSPTKPTIATTVIYWVTTVLIALPAISGIFVLIFKPEMAKEGATHLGLPQWFSFESSIGSTIGGLILLLPVWKRLKEWAYVAFGIMYISAFIAHLTIDGFGSNAISAIVLFAILLTSYIFYHKINDR